MTGRLFCYGTLRFEAIVRAAIGRVPNNHAATAAGYACYAVNGRPYPALVAEQGAVASGLLYEGLTMEEFLKLDDYEGPEYDRRRILVEDIDGGRANAWGYIWKRQYRSQLRPERWDINTFERRDLPVYLKRLSAGCPE